MPCLKNVEIQNEIWAHDVLLLQDTDVPIDIEIFEMLFPLFKPYNLDDRMKHVLERLVYVVYSALNDLLVVMSKHFVFFKNH